MLHTLEKLKSGELLGLKRVNISCGLTEFPKEIYTLSESLEILDLSNNQLSALPNDLVLLKNLKTIFLGNNKFTEFPKILAKLPVLSMIGFKSNQIANIPENAFPPLLRWLILTNNNLQKLPKSIGTCKYLQKFLVAGNLIEELPNEMANCKNLELLRISSNKLKTIPDWLFQLPKLSWVAFGGNPATHKIKIENEIASYDWNDFNIHQVLGQGASGVISKAHWLSKNKAVAIKVFKGAVTSDGLPEDEMKASIAAEQHLNLIPILGKIKNHPERKHGLLMEFISPDFINLGNPPSLVSCTRDVFDEKTSLAINDVVKIATNMASVAAHLHNKGINHGDLYAHNILINKASKILFGDFGAATFYDTNSKLAKHIERVEVRAFGCLLEDVLALVDESEIETPLYIHLQKIKQRCFAVEVKNRPSFSEITKELSNIKNS
ncbi:leucine-rich repeat-containing protein kinase family protein [Polaribacter sp. R77954]|uniref:leucine-rich repeat-containing protein kinase family protein n=1 Tax=Polaribacter sp. R77954 TaxID=3093870 RepID=UPI0037CCA4BA